MILNVEEDVVVRGAELTVAEREEISRGLSAGESGRMIARRLGRDDTVINREIRRHGGRDSYRVLAAQARAERDRRVAADGIRRGLA